MYYENLIEHFWREIRQRHIQHIHTKRRIFSIWNICSGALHTSKYAAFQRIIGFSRFFSVLQRSLNNVRSYGNCVMVKKTFEWCNDISFRHVVTMFRNQVLYYILSAGICKSMCSPNQLTCEIHLHLLAFIDGSNSNSSVSIALYVRVDILRWNYYTAARCICTAGLWSPHPCHSSCALSQRRL